MIESGGYCILLWSGCYLCVYVCESCLLKVAYSPPQKPLFINKGKYNQAQVSHIHRKLLTSELKNKGDIIKEYITQMNIIIFLKGKLRCSSLILIMNNENMVENMSEKCKDIDRGKNIKSNENN